MQDQIQQLQSVLPQLKGGDVEFAQSLIAGYKKHGGLTPKQAPWVPKLIERATAAKPEAKPAASVGSIAGVIELFGKAAKTLKHPVITMLVDGSEIKISRAADTSANPGFVYVRYEGQYAGKVSPKGDWFPLKSTDSQGFIWKILKDFAEKPAETAAAYGKLTGKCCFCNSGLTDKKSTAVGYGPVCAKHYDLPWGENWSQHAAAVGPAILKGDGKAQPAEEVDEVIEFEKMQIAEKKLRFTPIPGRACKDLLEMMQ